MDEEMLGDTLEPGQRGEGRGGRRREAAGFKPPAPWTQGIVFLRVTYNSYLFKNLEAGWRVTLSLPDEPKGRSSNFAKCP